MGEYLSRYWDWARSVHPFIGPVPAPDPLPSGERWRIEALVTAHGSEDVQQLLDRWASAPSESRTQTSCIRMADESRDPGPELDQEALRERRALEDYRKAMRDAADAIRTRMRAELAGQAEIIALAHRGNEAAFSAALAEYLGHTDPGFTLRVYAHLTPTASDRMRKAVDGLFSGEADGPATAQGGVR